MPNFERRHYRMMAELLRKVAVERDMSRPSFNLIKTLLGDMFYRDNPRFDRGKFEEACEP